MKISSIIVSFNAEKYIGTCIRSIQRQLSHLDYEIIVIDNNSHDQTTNFVRKTFPEVKLIENRWNMGFGAANNKAVKQASGDILLLANPDTETVFSINKLIESSLLPDVGAVFGKLKYPNGTVQEFIRNFPNFRNQIFEILKFPLRFKLFSGYGEMIRTTNDIYETGGKILAASGAYFVMKKSIFDHFKGFDEDYFIYGEETDLFYRMNQQGLHILYYPEVIIFHHHGKSTAGNPKMYVLLQKNRSLFIRKNYSFAKYILFRYFFQFTYDFTRMLFTSIKLLSCFKSPDPYQYYCFKRHLLAMRWEWFSIE